MITSALADPASPGRSAGASPRACHHFPRCPAATAPGRDAARTVAAHPEQGWSLLCNGVILFDDTGELLPGRSGLGLLPAGLLTALAPGPYCGVRGRGGSGGTSGGADMSAWTVARVSFSARSHSSTLRSNLSR